MIDSDCGLGDTDSFVGRDVPLMKNKQTHWMVGFDYVVGENAWLAINYGMINVTNDYRIPLNFEGSARNLPDYYPKASNAVVYQHKFSQSIFEASINVEF